MCKIILICFVCMILDFNLIISQDQEPLPQNEQNEKMTAESPNQNETEPETVAKSSRRMSLEELGAAMDLVQLENSDPRSLKNLEQNIDRSAEVNTTSSHVKNDELKSEQPKDILEPINKVNENDDSSTLHEPYIIRKEDSSGDIPLRRQEASDFDSSEVLTHIKWAEDDASDKTSEHGEFQDKKLVNVKGLEDAPTYAQPPITEAHDQDENQRDFGFAPVRSYNNRFLPRYPAFASTRQQFNPPFSMPHLQSPHSTLFTGYQSPDWLQNRMVPLSHRKLRKSLTIRKSDTHTIDDYQDISENTYTYRYKSSDKQQPNLDDKTKVETNDFPKRTPIHNFPPVLNPYGAIPGNSFNANPFRGYNSYYGQPRRFAMPSSPSTILV